MSRSFTVGSGLKKRPTGKIDKNEEKVKEDIKPKVEEEEIDKKADIAPKDFIINQYLDEDGKEFASRSGEFASRSGEIDDEDFE